MLVAVALDVDEERVLVEVEVESVEEAVVVALPEVLGAAVVRVVDEVPVLVAVVVVVGSSEVDVLAAVAVALVALVVATPVPA